MRQDQDFDKTIRIPIVTDVVAAGDPAVAGAAREVAPAKVAGWSHRQESNLYLALRRRPFYPLNYGGQARGL